MSHESSTGDTHVGLNSTSDTHTRRATQNSPVSQPCENADSEGFRSLGSKSSIKRAIDRGFLRPARTLGFWGAVVLPFLHLPLLFSGIGNSGEVIAFFALIVLNALAVVVGHPHDA